MEFEKVKNYIKNLLIDNDIEPKEEIFDKLEKYYNLLIEYNKNVNLTAITDKNEVYIKHFADSILGIKNYKKESTVCDIGSGAGFPGIILKIIRPDLKLTLVDSLNKRVIFLNNIINTLDLKDISALHYRAEDLEFKNSHLNSFDYVVARAVAPLNTLTEYCLPYVNIGGSFIAYKSQNTEEEIVNAKNCINKLSGSLDTIENYKLFDIYDRKLVIIKKLANTSKLYPRDKNKPKTQPL